MENNNFDHIYLGFNREPFIKDILEKDFNANIRACALALNMAPNYLHDLIFTPTRGAGNKTLSRIYQYCKKTNRNPETYIFIEK